MGDFVFLSILYSIFSKYVERDHDLGGRCLVWTDELRDLGFVAIKGVVEAAAFAAIFVIGLKISRPHQRAIR